MTADGSKELPRGVFERPPGSGHFWIRYADSLGRERREFVGPKQKQAEDLYHKRKGEVRERRQFPENMRDRGVKFSELATDFLEFSRLHHTPLTYDSNKRRMARLLVQFRDRAAEGITPQDVVRFLSSEKWSPASRNRFRALLSGVFTLGQRNDRIESHPIKKVQPFKENNARVRFLETDEEKRLRAAIVKLHPKREPEFDLALNTGMRRGEQFRLKWTDVDFRRKILTVADSKNHERRHIPLNDAALAALKLMSKRPNRKEFVVPARSQQRTCDWSEWFPDCVKKAKVADFTWHCLRHTFASRLVMAGADIRTVQDLLGHKTISMTVRYAHLSAPHKRSAVQSLGRKPSAAPTGTTTAPPEEGEEAAAEVVQTTD